MKKLTMRHFYMRISMVAMTLLMASGMMAQTIGYAITSNVNSKECTIFSFDTSDPSTVVETIWTDTVADQGAVMATLADSIYYAYITPTGGSSYHFYSINMMTGNKVKLGFATPGGTEYWYDFCHEPVGGKLYGLRKADKYELVDSVKTVVGSENQICTVNPSTGAWTKLMTLPEELTSASYYLGPICADGKGGLYVMGANKISTELGNKLGLKAYQMFHYSYINIYHIDLATQEATALIENNESAVVKKMYSNLVGPGARVAMELHDGLLYIVGNNNFITLDMATTTATISDKTFTGEPVGLCFSKSWADGTPSSSDDAEEEEDTRLVKVIETYGDHMAEREGQMTHKRIYLYDNENRLQRETTYGYSYANAITGVESKWEIEYFKTYAYNEAGQLEKTYSQKYGVYDGTDLAFVDNEDTIAYEYDEAGNKVKEILQSGGYNMLYEYNEAGQLVKEIKQLPDYYDQYEGDYYNMYEITYSAFNSFGQPDSIYCTGLYETDQYFGVYTYDTKGRKIEAHTWTIKDTTDVKIETWTYNDDESNDTVMVYWSHEWFSGFDQGEKRTVQTYDNGNVNRIKTQTQSLSNGAWVNDPTYSITEMSEMNPEAVATLEVTNGEQKSHVAKDNCALITLTLPDAAVTGTLAFDVYRHGILLTRLNAADAVDGKLTYTDEAVKNGTYDYYVQTVLVNELLETEEALNISNVETYTHYAYLPEVRYISCTSARLEGGIYYATIEWEGPIFGEVDEWSPWIGHAFQRYNVMLEKMKAADNAETDGQALTWEVNCGSTGKVNLYIQTVYTYGKSNSEMFSIDAQAVMDAQGIEGVAADNAVTVNAGVVSVSAPAHIVVYSAQGAQVAEVADATSLDLNTLPAGIYLVKVKTADGVKTLKINN